MTSVGWMLLGSVLLTKLVMMLIYPREPSTHQVLAGASDNLKKGF